MAKKKQLFEGFTVTDVTENTVSLVQDEQPETGEQPREITGKRTFNTKIYECCATEKTDLRPLLQCVFFENGYAYASDGIVLIKQSLSLQSVIDPEELDGKFLPRDSYKSIMGFEIAQCNPDGVECWNTNGQKVFFEYYKPKETDRTPNYEAMLSRRGVTSLSFIGINPAHLMRIRHALYVPRDCTVRLQFTGVDKAILIDVPGVEEQEAILVPTIINATLF